MLYVPSSSPSCGELRAMQPEAIVRDFGPMARAAFGSDGAVAVLIPAHNEQADLPATLAKLAQSSGTTVSPVVVANNCSDSTSELAAAMGARVITEPTPGKMIATQTGLRTLAAEGHTTVLLTDADTLHPMQWASRMSRLAQTAADTGGIVLGTAVFMDGGRVDTDLARTLWVNGQDLLRYRSGRGMIASGYNMGLQLDPCGVLLRELLALENYFPGEDAAMRDTVRSVGGTVINTLHLHTVVRTRGDRHNQRLIRTAIASIRKRLGTGPMCIADYSEYDTRAAVPYSGKN